MKILRKRKKSRREKYKCNEDITKISKKGNTRRKNKQMRMKEIGMEWKRKSEQRRKGGNRKQIVDYE